MGMMQQFYNKTQVVIDIVHQRAHEGRYFSGGYYNASVANNGVIELILQTSSEQDTHTKVHVAAGGDATIQIYEGATFSNAGTSVAVSNHNRKSSKSFAGTLTHTPTLTGTGTQINGTQFLPGGGIIASIGGEYDFSNEFILDNATTYLFRATNISGSATDMIISFQCYQPDL